LTEYFGSLSDSCQPWLFPNSQWLLCILLCLLHKNSNFCQHRVIMCSLYTSEQRESFSVYRNTWVGVYNTYRVIIEL
jgi:hypothetical protein